MIHFMSYVIHDSFCNIVNVFTVIFNYFNSFLLNKSIYLFQKSYWPQTFNQILKMNLKGHTLFLGSILAFNIPLTMTFASINY